MTALGVLFFVVFRGFGVRAHSLKYSDAGFGRVRVENEVLLKEKG